MLNHSTALGPIGDVCQRDQGDLHVAVLANHLLERRVSVGGQWNTFSSPFYTQVGREAAVERTGMHRQHCTPVFQ